MKNPAFTGIQIQALRAEKGNSVAGTDLEIAGPGNAPGAHPTDYAALGRVLGDIRVV